MKSDAVVKFNPADKTVVLHGDKNGVGIVNRRELTDEQLRENDLTLQLCARVMGWEWADNTLELMDRKFQQEVKQMRLDFETRWDGVKITDEMRVRKRVEGAELARLENLPADEREKRTRESVREYARVRNYAPQTVLKRVCVAEFFPIERRDKRSTYSHHEEVWACGVFAIDEACAWLDRAVKGDGEGRSWSVARLRLEITASRAAKKDEPDDDGPLLLGLPKEASQFNAWAAGHWADFVDVEAEDAATWLADFAAAIRLIDHLRSRAQAAQLSA